MRVTPGQDMDALLRDMQGRLARLEESRRGVVKVQNGSQIGGVKFITQRTTDGTLELYAEDAERGVRTLIVSIA